jgi:hypothetical protein
MSHVEMHDDFAEVLAMSDLQPLKRPFPSSMEFMTRDYSVAEMLAIKRRWELMSDREVADLGFDPNVYQKSSGSFSPHSLVANLPYRTRQEADLLFFPVGPRSHQDDKQ